MFGENVAVLVQSVTEDAELSWEENKAGMLSRVKEYSHDSLLVKSADLISNGTELMDDYREFSDEIFANFERPKDIQNNHYIHMVEAVIARWPESPLAEDLRSVKEEMAKLF
jgi:hypothetical protein